MSWFATGLNAQTKGLTKEEAAKITQQLIEKRQEESAAKWGAEWSARELTNGEYKMKFYYKVFGDKPEDGRAMYISMHGGGGCPPEINDQQWNNQKQLYTPSEGVYFVPRAPIDSWDMWHQGYMDGFIKKAIELAVIYEGVNPNKVYIMGYSAGGDGTYQLAPRLADKWAAAAMCAGHPGDARIENLMNLPFAIFVGGKDEAYQRNTIAEDWGKWLGELASRNEGKYINSVNIYPDCGHWMLRKDTVAVSWMAKFERDAVPNKIHWVQDDVIRNNFYWLQATAGSKDKRAEVIASYEGNNIYIQRAIADSFYVRLNDTMLDLDKPVTVYYRGAKVFKGKLSRSEETIKEDVNDYRDINQVFSAKILITPKDYGVE